jgi:hypothetical protein
LVYMSLGISKSSMHHSSMEGLSQPA